MMKEKRTTYCKIGFSKAPLQRKSIIQSGNPRQLILVDWFEVSNNFSDSIFKYEFSKYHVEEDGGTEWYKIPKKEFNKVKRKVKKICKQKK